jgi:hypothetical protein
MYFKETEWEGVEWIHMAHGWKGNEILGFYKIRASFDQISDC